MAGLGAKIAAAGQLLSEHQDKEAEFDTERRFQEFQWNHQLKLDEQMQSVEPGQAAGFADRWANEYRESAKEFFSSVPDSQKMKYDQRLFGVERDLYSKANVFGRTEQKRSSLRSIEDAGTNIYFPRASKGDSIDAVKRDYQGLINSNPYLSPIEKDEVFRKAIVDLEKTHFRGRLERGEDIDSAINDVRGGMLDTDVDTEARAQPFTREEGTGDLAAKAAEISVRLETGKKDPLKGIANISADSAGTRSYGNFGLNSGGSAQKFVAEYGKEFGFTAEPGTKEFDTQWREAASKAPNKLHAAEMDWYSKNVVGKVGARLVNAGVPEAMANDPRVQAYFADRSIQQGPESIDGMAKHAKRIKSAADEAGGDPAKFLKAITEADRAALQSDFPTAIRTGVYGKRGHDNRVDGRLRMALNTEGVGTAKEWIKRSFSGPYQHLSPDDRISLIREAKTAWKQEIAEARNNVAEFENAAEKGYSPPAERLEALRGKVARLRDQETLQSFRQAEAMLEWQKVARQARPEELDAFIRKENERLSAGGATPHDIKRVELADKLLTNMRQELKQDALGWAERVGLTKIAPIDFTSPEAAQASLTARTTQVDDVAKHYGIKPRYLRPDEAEAFKTAISEGGDQTLAVASAIASAGGSRAPAIIGEVFKDSPSAAAMIGGLVAETGTIAPAARDAADAMMLKKEKDFKPLTAPSQELRRRAVEVLGSAFSGLPKTESAAVAAADLVYETRARRAGLTEFDYSVWQQGLREVIGERAVGGKTYGGIVDADPSVWGNRKIVIPANISQDDWRLVVDSLKPEDLTASGLGLPAGADGKPVPISRVKGAILVQTGDGRYALSLGDPNTPGEERWIVMADAPSQPFELDFAKLKPIMQKRHPGLYLGEPTE